MPFTPEQQKAYYEANKLKLNQQRAERRKLKRLGQSNNLKANVLQVETPERVETFSQVETDKQVETLKVNIEVETKTEPLKVETLKELSQPKAINGKCQGYGVNPHTKEHYCNSCEYHQHRNKTKPWLKVIAEREKKSIQPKLTITSNLCNYYNCKKPHCQTCIEQGIKDNEVLFHHQETPAYLWWME